MGVVGSPPTGSVIVERIFGGIDLAERRAKSRGRIGGSDFCGI